jgi:hypothetical protein
MARKEHALKIDMNQPRLRQYLSPQTELYHQLTHAWLPLFSHVYDALTSTIIVIQAA